MKDRLVTIALSVAATYGLMKGGPEPPRVLEVDRLVVRKELIVSDTGLPWEKGFEARQIPRGLYARSLGDGPRGLCPQPVHQRDQGRGWCRMLPAAFGRRAGKSEAGPVTDDVPPVVEG